MSKHTTQAPVSIDIDDLTEVVGGLSFTVQPLNQKLVSASPLSSVAHDPDTCPTTPGTPLSSCMCPGVKGGIGGGAVINPVVGF
jgi:hypothetical protein